MYSKNNLYKVRFKMLVEMGEIESPCRRFL
jgi:hypothetical protein